ncbi:MAG: sigma 54-interacting transcriptional regulator [Desulfobacterales bacterium]
MADAINFSTEKMVRFIKVNCGAIPESLMDSELFGHEKSAAAHRLKNGDDSNADHGTIFLMKSMNSPLRHRFACFGCCRKKDRTGRRLKEISVNVRIISATHRDLRDMVAKGSSGEDLWFRINVFPIHIPPLRERKEDIPALAEYFIEKKTLELKLKKRPDLQVNALYLLLSHDWPGNVRELQNLIGVP